MNAISPRKKKPNEVNLIDEEITHGELLYLATWKNKLVKVKVVDYEEFSSSHIVQSQTSKSTWAVDTLYHRLEGQAQDQQPGPFGTTFDMGSQSKNSQAAADKRRKKGAAVEEPVEDETDEASEGIQDTGSQANQTPSARPKVRKGQKSGTVLDIANIEEKVFAEESVKSSASKPGLEVKRPLEENAISPSKKRRQKGAAEEEPTPDTENVTQSMDDEDISEKEEPVVEGEEEKMKKLNEKQTRGKSIVKMASSEDIQDTGSWVLQTQSARLKVPKRRAQDQQLPGPSGSQPKNSRAANTLMQSIKMKLSKPEEF